MKNSESQYSNQVKFYMNQCIVLMVTLSGCSFVEIDPPKSQLVTESVYQTDQTANSAVTLAYASFARDQMTYNLPHYTGLYADELKNAGVGLTENAYNNSFEPISLAPVSFWNNLYKYIYIANSIIEGINKSTSMTVPAKTYFKGEALFLRAFWNFYLVNLYGDVPIILNTDYAENAQKSKSPIAEVYQQIISDLQEAIILLPDDYLSGDGIPGSSERVRANKNAARALLARVYLYVENFDEAEKISTSLIEQVGLFEPVPVNQVFLKNSKETILAIPPSVSGATYNTQEGRSFIVRSNSPVSVISDQLLNRFTQDDLRYQNWIGYRDNTAAPLIRIYFPYKYKMFDASSISEYSIVLRIAEQFLIRAEARAELGNLPGSRSDLNVVRKRSAVNLSTSSEKEKLKEEILLERQKELFAEWGHRWLDLKRTGRVNEVMNMVSPLKGGKWEPYKAYWPIAQNELLLNRNLVQTSGYTQ